MDSAAGHKNNNILSLLFAHLLSTDQASLTFNKQLKRSIHGGETLNRTNDKQPYRQYCFSSIVKLQ